MSKQKYTESHECFSIGNGTYAAVYNIEQSRYFKDQRVHPAFCQSLRNDLQFDLETKTNWSLQSALDMPPLDVDCSGTLDTFCLKPLLHDLDASSFTVGFCNH